MTEWAPSDADMAFKQYAGSDLFEIARLMQSISVEYLSVLAHDNSAPTDAGFKAMVDAEVARRGTLEAQRANKTARWSFAIAILACVIAASDAIFGG